MRAKFVSLATAAALVVTLGWVGAVQAEGEDSIAESGLEVGGFLGLHIFNDDLELGVYDGPDRDSPKNAFAFGLRLGYAVNYWLAAEGELAVMPTGARDGDASLFVAGWRANVLISPLRGKIQPFLLAGIGAHSGISGDDTEFADDTDAALHAGVGARYFIGNDWGARGDAKVLFPPSTDDDGPTLDLEFTVGLFKRFGFAKVEEEPEPVDTDGDGITDDVDKCPEEPEDADGFEDEDGCPDNDNDGDGIVDASDKCPDVAEDKNGIDDEDGCPEEDRDGDGLLGSQDQCPEEPEDKDNFQDDDGCPDTDNDGDGIADGDDKCPIEAETVNQYEDTDGCPDEVPEEIQRFTGVIKGIKFRLGKAKIRRSSFKTLNQAAEVLVKYSNVKLEIQGHTDSTGSEDRNRKLSQDRAEAVRAYLISKGVDGGRLEAKGYGPDVAIGDNKNRRGRAQNRRVEFMRK